MAATAYSTEMTLLTGNAGGNVQSLPPVSTIGSRKRNWVATIPLASQAIGTVIGVARLPKGFILTGIEAVTDTSLGTATIAFGDVNTPTLFASAQTLTATQTRTLIGAVATLGVVQNGPLYDCVTGLVNLDHEDIVMTVGTAALPASGTLKVIFDYSID